jgi:hypothetical protein
MPADAVNKGKQKTNKKRSNKEGLSDEFPHKDPKTNTQEGVGGDTASVMKRKTRKKTGNSTTSNKQEYIGGGGTASAGPITKHKTRTKSSDSTTSLKTTKRKGVKKLSNISPKEATVEEPAVKKRPMRMVGPAQKFDVVSHTPEGIRDVRPAPLFLPSPPNSGDLQEVFPRALDDHDHLGQDAAFKKIIHDNVTLLPTPDSTISPPRKTVALQLRV